MAALVLDNGSETTKAGFVGDDEPRAVFRSVVGRARTQGEKDFYVGDEAQKRRDVLDLTNPIERGLITHWDHMERLWHHTFYNELKVAPEKHRVLLSEVPFNTATHREKTAQIMFEMFNINGLFLVNQAALSLFSSGRTTGVVTECGAGVTHTVPFHQGFPVPNAGLSVDLGGRDLTDYLLKMLTERGYSFSSAAERDVVQDIKEKLCYLPLTFKTEMMKEPSSVEKNYQLPDGKTITIGSELFRCPEVLLQPSLIGKACQGLHTAAFECVMKCGADIRTDLWKNLVVSGGSSLFQGIAERLKKDVTALGPSADVKVLAPAHRQFSVWIGGSILAGLPAEERWISKAQYEECGVAIIHQRCS